MLRKTVSIILAVSFIAMASSGMMMFFTGNIAYQLKMHPVHNVFGLIMVIAGIIHFILNIAPLAASVRRRKLALTGGVMVVLMIVLYAAGLHRTMDPVTVQKISDIMREQGH
jgi:cellulose synthase/poly-beta-1,6-N-acetylglucosamine synthase-like glycosyltransferase